MRTSAWFRLWPALLCLTLAGCQGGPSRHGFYDSPLLPGDEVEIRRSVEVPAGMARVYLQHGRTLSYGGTDQYAPFCYFLLRDPLPTAQTIAPQVLVVERSWLNQTSVGVNRPSQVASALSLGGSYSPIAWQFHITLRRADDSRLTLVCSGAFDSPATAAPIRLPELRQALGDFAVVRVRAAHSGQ